MKPSHLLLIGAGLGLTAYIFNKPYKFPIGKGGDSDIDRDPSKLLLGFRAKLARVFQRMEAQGFRPILWEGRRSANRAKRLDTRGTGIKQSLHRYGIAADVVDRDLLWNAPKTFWDALTSASLAEGLYPGSQFTDPDPDHVQAISPKQTPKFLAMSLAQQMQYIG